MEAIGVWPETGAAVHWPGHPGNYQSGHLLHAIYYTGFTERRLYIASQTYQQAHIYSNFEGLSGSSYQQTWLLPDWVVSGLLFYVLATHDVISQWLLTCESGHSLWLYSAGPLGNQATSNITWYPTQPQYPDTEQTSLCPILIMLSAYLGCDKYQFQSH